MTAINKDIPVKELAMIICKALKDDGIDAVLTGGAVVTIYSENRYLSKDLDFISHGNSNEIERVMNKLGFRKSRHRYYEHPSTDFFVEFPTPPVAIGNRPIDRFEEIENERGYLKLLTPTHCVMDRLAAYYHWNDMQSLEQAVMVANAHPVDMREVDAWSNEEGMHDKLEKFKQKLK